MRLLKNFIYNFSDIFVALIIIVLAAILIFTRVNVILAYPNDGKDTKQIIAEAIENESGDTSESEDNPTAEDKSDGIPEASYVKKVENGDTSYKEVGIAAGTTTESIAELLKQNSVISDMSYFIAQLRGKNLEGQIEPGVYNIPKGSSMDDLINILCKKTESNTAENSNYIEVSIPKDSSTEVVAGLLKQAGLITETNNFTSEIESMNLEGKIDPGAYQIPKGCSMQELINILCKIQN